MIESLTTSSDIPLLLRGLCTLGGMSLYLATLAWLSRLAFGLGNILTLRQMSIIWLARVLAACTLASLSMMIYTGQVFADPVMAAPEIAILLLLAALYLLIEKRRFLKRRHIVTRRLPGEIISITGVTAACFAALFVVAGFLQLAMRVNSYVHGPDWAPVLAAGLLSLVPLAALTITARERDVTERLKFHQLLVPVLLACLLIMVPDIVAYLRSSPKVKELLHTHGQLQKAENSIENGAGKHNPEA
jgi:hypothetical protein